LPTLSHLTIVASCQVTRRGIRIVVYVLLLAHIFACFWFYLGWSRVSSGTFLRDANNRT
jgi:hypothetical protein